jgi:hypothetical protein
VLEEPEARIPIQVRDVLIPARIEIVEPEDLDTVIAKTIAQVGPQEPGGARNEGSNVVTILSSGPDIPSRTVHTAPRASSEYQIAASMCLSVTEHHTSA